MASFVVKTGGCVLHVRRIIPTGFYFYVQCEEKERARERHTEHCEMYGCWAKHEGDVFSDCDWMWKILLAKGVLVPCVDANWFGKASTTHTYIPIPFLSTQIGDYLLHWGKESNSMLASKVCVCPHACVTPFVYDVCVCI